MGKRGRYKSFGTRTKLSENIAIQADAADDNDDAYANINANANTNADTDADTVHGFLLQQVLL